ncbi:MAG: hypothetical protein IPK83_01110 [Planctomycetes bacterium]|nr:hypothetical protein [Planctomycetota bacterium]
MSAHATQTGLSYLIVFDGHDDAICSAGELMMNHGSQVQWVPDVYSAMAQLCTGNLPSRLIVDVRILDESELAFINLAPRYFPELKVTVPTLDGTLSRINGFKGRYETLSLTDITDEALGIRAAVADEITDEAEVVEWGGEEAVATDEAIEDNPMRPDSPRMNPSNDSAITPEEMDALLADDADASERGADR